MQARDAFDYRRLIAGLIALMLFLAVVPPAGASGGSAGSSGPSDTEVITLITGDEVLLETFADGTQAATVDPAPRETGEPPFHTNYVDDQVYVYPADALPLIPDTLDRELFNVSKLAEYGYTGEELPVIATTADVGAAQDVAALEGLTQTTGFTSIPAVAVDVAGLQFWPDVIASDSSPTAGPLAGVDKLWLDGQVEVMLDESVERIGAPEAWDAGFDGEGMTVAVLDTGIDDEHPDLEGQVAAAEDFTDEGNPIDEHGHGTHVAGTAAGTGDVRTASTSALHRRPRWSTPRSWTPAAAARSRGSSPGWNGRSKRRAQTSST